VHRGRDADAGLDHAADHAFHAVHRGDVGDAHRVGDAAGLHQLDVDDVRGALPDQFDHLGRAEHAFVRHHRRVDALGDVLQTGEVVRAHRLLQQFEMHAGIFECMDRVHRLLRGPALVGVEAEQSAAVDRGMDRLDPFDVEADVLADFDLQRLEATRDRRQRIGDHLVDVVDADGDVGGDDRIAAAEHPVQRRAVELAEQVVHRDLDRGLGAGVAFECALDRLRDAVEVGDLAADQARRDVACDRICDRAMRVAGDHRCRRRLAVADVPGVGVHADHDVLDRVDRAQRGLERCLQGHAQQAEADVGDFHAGVL
jgi:hypothetical protein